MWSGARSSPSVASKRHMLRGHWSRSILPTPARPVQAAGCSSRKGLSVRWHACPACGTSLHRDHNAARNIQWRPAAPSGTRWGAGGDEPRTRGALARAECQYQSWKFWAPTQEAAARSRVFAEGTWGGTFREEFMPRPGEIVALEHWCSSGFANTDLDLQLKKHSMQRVIVIGLLANTCIDSTVRYAAELGYEVTLVKDAIGSRSWDEMKATLEVNAPHYAQAILATEELLAALQNATE